MKSFLQLNLAKLSSRSKNLRDQVRGMLQVFVVATIDKHGRNLVYKRQADTIFDVIEHALGLSKKVIIKVTRYAGSMFNKKLNIVNSINNRVSKSL